jgi:hypothetical protein
VKGTSSISFSSLETLSEEIKMAEYDCLDIMSETQSLLPEEFARIKQISTEINKICAMEEIKARQRSREREKF